MKMEVDVEIGNGERKMGNVRCEKETKRVKFSGRRLINFTPGIETTTVRN